MRDDARDRHVATKLGIRTVVLGLSLLEPPDLLGLPREKEVVAGLAVQTTDPASRRGTSIRNCARTGTADRGGLTAGSARARLLQAMLQNTLEQGALALPVYLFWALDAPPRLVPAVAGAALLFLVGRILFFRGYARGAAGRALGFRLSFYPTVVLLLAAVVRLVTGFPA